MLAPTQAKLDEISDPLNINYGQWMTMQQVQEMKASLPEVREAVLRWVLNHVPRSAVGVRSDSIDFVASVRAVERMFQTKVKSFEHEITHRRVLAAVGGWSVPAELREHIELVTGISDFPVPRSSAIYGEAKATIAAGGSSNPYSPESQYMKSSALGESFWPQFGRIVIPTLWDLYNISSDLSAAGSSQSVVEYQGTDCFSWQQVQFWAQQSGVPFTNTTLHIGDGSFINSGCQSESTLDVQQLTGVGTGALSMYFSVANWIYEFTQLYQALPEEQSPMITTHSYGWMETEQCQLDQQTCSQLGVDNNAYVLRCETELAALGAAGKTMVFCTQDEGAPSDNNVDLTNARTPVTPIYPGSSAYGLAVGATTLLDKYPGPNEARAYDTAPICSQIHCSQGTQEVVAMAPNAAFTSGGGFSNVIPAPSWNAKQTAAYLAGSGLRPAKGKFNPAMRGYPDLSAVGESIYYYSPSGSGTSSGGTSTSTSSTSSSSELPRGQIGGHGRKPLSVAGANVHFEGGTSASTPIVAGMMSLLNAHQIKNGQPVLGYVTPLIYQIGTMYPQVFNDITEGNNTCTGWSRTLPCCHAAATGDDAGDDIGRVCSYGYSAQNGWDPATGWGTINFGRLIEAVDAINAQRAALIKAHKHRK